MRISLSVLLLGVLLSTFSCQEKSNTNTAKNRYSEKTDSLSIALQGIQNKNALPGFAVSIFTKDSIIYQKGYGYSNLETKTPYRTDNVQIIASITKTLIGVSLMKAVEDGKIHLDDPINDILPFKVYNPKFPSIPITVRHLATHTSSISSSKTPDEGYRFKTPLLKENFPQVYDSLLDTYNKTEELSMANYLRYKLSENEKWYDKDVFTQAAPGTSYEYSNLGAALLAYCIELQSGVAFNTYSDTLILKSLNMDSSTWFLNEVDEKRHVTYYNEILNEVPKYTIVSYPDGGLYSSVSDLTTYLQEMMKGYSGEGTLLSKASYKEMMTKQYANEELTEGLCWDLGMGADLIGHAGNDFGTATLAYFSPSTGIGMILFTNITIEKEEQEDAFYGIYNLLFQYEFNE